MTENIIKLSITIVLKQYSTNKTTNITENIFTLRCEK